MMRPTTEQQLSDSIPRYVATAMTLAQSAITEALHGAESDIRVCVWRRGRIGVITETAAVADMWRQRQDDWPERQMLKADVPYERTRLALRWQPGRLATWLYAPPEAVTDDPALACGEKSSVIRSPYIEFYEAEAGADEQEQIKMRLCTSATAPSIYNAPLSNILQVTAEDHLNAAYPPLSEHDRTHLATFGVHAFHAARVEALLRLLQLRSKG